MALLGIDVGSSSCKAVVFDEHGRQLASGTCDYSLVRPEPNQAELDPDVLYAAVVAATRQAATDRADEIEALAVSSHGESFIPMGGDGKPTGRMVMNSDNRAVEQAARIERELGRERIYAITGSPPHAMFALVKIMWQRERGMADAVKYLSAGDYILHRMGCGFLTDYSLASRTMCFDINRKGWSRELLDAAGLTADHFPEPMPSGTVAGRLESGAAAELGLRRGVAVAAGGHDQPCGALGAGVIRAGEASISAGTYESVVIASDMAMNTPQSLRYSLNSYRHVVPDKFITLAFFPGGMGVRWLIDELCQPEAWRAREEGRDVFSLLEEEQLAYPGPTGILVVPHWGGACTPYWDVSATGAVVGLTPACTRAKLYKAAYEGVACELAVNIDVLESVAGRLSQLRISGGGASSPFTVKLRADIAGREMVILNTRETVCQGAAMLAGVGVGTFAGFEAAAESMLDVKEVVSPDAVEVAAYASQRARYAKFVQDLLRR